MNRPADLEYERRHKALLTALPPSGPLRLYLDWVTQTTDADLGYHLACALVLWSHHMNTAQCMPPSNNAFRSTFWIVGRAASSKSTAIKRMQRFYEAVIAHREKQGGFSFSQRMDPFIQAGGTPQGLFETIADMADPETGRHLGIFFHEEVSSQFQVLGKHQTQAYVEFLLQQLEGTRMDRNLVRIRQANLKGGKEVKTLKDYAFPGVFATTFGSLGHFFDRSLITGGLFSRLLFSIGSQGDLKHALHVRPAPQDKALAVKAWQEWDTWLMAQRTAGRTGTPTKVTLSDTLVEDLVKPSLFRKLQTADEQTAASYKRGIDQAKDIAALYALSGRRTEINHDDLKAAIKIVMTSINGMQVIAQQARTDDNPHAPKIALAFRLIRGAGKGGMKHGEVLKSIDASRRVVEEVLQHLEELDVIGQIKIGGGRGRPSRGYVALRETLDPNGKLIGDHMEIFQSQFG